MFSKKLNAKLDQYHLLNHPFTNHGMKESLLEKLLKIMLNNITSMLKHSQDILVQRTHYVRILKKEKFF